MPDPDWQMQVALRVPAMPAHYGDEWMQSAYFQPALLTC